MLHFVVSTDDRKDGGCRKGWFYSSEEIDGSHLIPFNDQRIEELSIEVDKILPLVIAKVALGDDFKKLSEGIDSFQERFNVGAVNEKTADWTLPEENFFDFISEINEEMWSLWGSAVHGLTSRIEDKFPFNFSIDCDYADKVVRGQSVGEKILFSRLYGEGDCGEEFIDQMINKAMAFTEERQRALGEEPKRPSIKEGMFLKGREILPFMIRLYKALMAEKVVGVKIGGDLECDDFVGVTLFDIPPYNRELRWRFITISKESGEYWWELRRYTGLNIDLLKLVNEVYKALIEEIPQYGNQENS
jgi:hypothetical protein